MTAYADTSFVVTLYKEEDVSPSAAAAMRELTVPVRLSALGELEFHNALHLAVFRGEMEPAIAEARRDLFLSDLKQGVFLIHPVPASQIYPKALQLAARHTAALGTRSLDLMHVAAALLVEAGIFLSFDDRQRQAAAAEGLEVRP